jgi:hypothetical protein
MNPEREFVLDAALDLANALTPNSYSWSLPDYSRAEG